jgi:hypothetical protein
MLFKETVDDEKEPGGRRRIIGEHNSSSCARYAQLSLKSYKVGPSSVFGQHKNYGGRCGHFKPAIKFCNLQTRKISAETVKNVAH